MKNDEVDRVSRHLQARFYGGFWGFVLRRSKCEKCLFYSVFCGFLLPGTSMYFAL